MLQLRQIVAVAGHIAACALVAGPVASYAHEPAHVNGAAAEPVAKATAQTKWSIEQIASARAQCDQLLKGLDIVALPVGPITAGDCGAPATIEVVSIGRKPEVAFSPPITITCELAVGLHRWLKDDVQPLARRHLGAPVVRIETMSSYSCRNAYGRAKTRMSEHGRANAVDIRGFLTAGNASAEVLADWGLTARDIRAQVAAAKAATERAEAAHIAAAKAQALLKPTLPAPSAAPAPAVVAKRPVPADSVVAQQPSAISVPRPTIAIGAPGTTVELPRGDGATGLGLNNILGQQHRLGGPKPAAAADQAGAADAKTQFLRAAHVAACRIFGTVLGPEANNAHRNHFHLDMAPRAKTNYCE